MPKTQPGKSKKGKNRVGNDPSTTSDETPENTVTRHPVTSDETETPQNTVPRLPVTSDGTETPENTVPRHPVTSDGTETPENTVPRHPVTSDGTETPENTVPRHPVTSDGTETPENTVPRHPVTSDGTETPENTVPRHPVTSDGTETPENTVPRHPVTSDGTETPENTVPRHPVTSDGTETPENTVPRHPVTSDGTETPENTVPRHPVTSDGTNTDDIKQDENTVLPYFDRTSDETETSGFKQDLSVETIRHISSVFNSMANTDNTNTSGAKNAGGAEYAVQGTSCSSMEQTQLNVCLTKNITYNVIGCKQVILPDTAQDHDEQPKIESDRQRNIEIDASNQDTCATDTLQTKTKKMKKGQPHDTKHSSVSPKIETDRLRNMKRAALQRLDDVDPNVYVQTRAYRKAEEMLHDLGIVVLIGSPGSGKTTLASSLMSRLKDQEDRQPLCITHYSQFEDIPLPNKEEERKNDKFLVLIDDIFGKTNLVTEYKNAWELKFETMWSLLQGDLVKLIISFRTQICSECYKSLREFDLFKEFHQINLNGPKYSLTTQEKLSILEKYLSCVSVPLSDNDKATIVDQSFIELGFPQCCKYFASSVEAQRRGIEFFKKPIEYLRIQFNTLKSNTGASQLQYIVMLLVMFKQGALKVDCLNPFEGGQQDGSKLTQLKEVCKIDRNVSLGQIKASADSLCGLYLQFSEKNREYSFVHQSVFDTLFLQFSSEFLQQSIRICPVEMLLEYVITPGAPKKGDITVMVKEDNYRVLAERFTVLLKSDNARRVLKHQSFKDKSFVMFLAEQFWDSKVPRDILTLNCDRKDHEIQVMFDEDKVLQLWKSYERDQYANCYKHSKKVIVVSSSLASIAVVENLKLLSKYFVTSLLKLPPSEIKHQQKELLEISCFVGNADVAEILLSSGIVPSMNTLTAAVSSHKEDAAVFNTMLDLMPDIEFSEKGFSSLLRIALERGNGQISSVLIDELSRMKDCHTFLEQAVKQLLLLCHKPTTSYRQKPPSYQSSLNIGAANLFKQLKEYLLICDYDVAVILAASHDDAGVLKELVHMQPACLNSKKINTTPFLAACYNGCKDSVEFLIDKRQNIELQRGLYLAVENNTSNVVSYLLHKGADANASDAQGNSPLHMAVHKHIMVENLKVLVERGAILNTINDWGNTPLHISAKNNSLKCVSYLVEKEANINIQNKCGKTPLLLASRHTSSDVGLYLLDKGADPNLADTDNDSPLHLAVMEDSVHLVRKLVEKEPNINIQNNCGKTPLLLASRHTSSDVGLYLLDKGADPNLADTDNDSPLHLAVMEDSVHLVRKLVEKEANLNAINCKGNTPLYNSAWSDSEECIKYLATKVSNINLQNNVGQTALHRVMYYEEEDDDDDDLIYLRHGSLNSIKALVENGANLNIVDNNGNTPLHYAVESLSTENVAYLIETGSDVTISNKRGVTSLHNLLKCSDPWYSLDKLKLLKVFHQKGADLNAMDIEGNTPLLLAAQYNQHKCVEYLIKKKSAINVSHKDGMTPLHYAAQDENEQEDLEDVDSVKSLVEHGADLNTINDDGDTPLHVAAKARSVEKITYLVEKGSKVNLPNGKGMTPLHLVNKDKNHFFELNNTYYEEMYMNTNCSDSKENEIQFLNRDSLDSGMILIEHGANVNATDTLENSPLHTAAENNSLNMITYLVEKGSVVNLQNKSGKTPLHLAAHIHIDSNRFFFHVKAIEFEYKVSFEVLKALVSKGASVNITDESGNTPLHIAVQFYFEKTVKYLIEKGSTVNLQNKNGMSPLHLATGLVKSYRTDRMRADGFSKLFADEYNVSVEAVKVLVTNGANVNVVDNSGNIPLHTAAQHHSNKTVTYLIENGSEVNKQNQIGMTPLHMAASRIEVKRILWIYNIETVTTLVLNGAKVNVVDESGNTPLHFAAHSHSEKTVTYLIENGSEVYLQNKRGMTPLHLAAEVTSSRSDMAVGMETEIYKIPWDLEDELSEPYVRERFNIMKALISNGAIVNVVDDSGNIPLHIAARCHSQTAIYLVQKGSDVNLRNKAGMTPLHLEAYRKILNNIFSDNDIRIVETLVLHGASVNVVDESGNTPLHFAAHCHSEKTVKYLIENGSNVNLPNKAGMTPLHLAANIPFDSSEEKGFKNIISFKTVEALVSNGASVNAMDKSLNTPLHFAAKSNSVQCVAFLIQNGSDINIRNRSNMTPLCLASNYVFYIFSR